MEQKFPNCMAMHLQKQNEGRIENKVKAFYKHLSMNCEYKHLRKGKFNTKVDNPRSSEL